ncbi:MAG: 16S rRNA (adenine(1518)-N(6)/adenine(1519)-N(6))-dimethyltransferase RsmA [Planctomycetaceae bacterium]|jgi:16S rRNA (adenine1518-N6/adenine1519-N6)-dimethyltransferase|nr:16S rRNA (adenine(1518)-N(6)/adenine(1519)-N(6))-dimethyltransferase RsmA [Planctomycetaceae bacterium]
MSTGSSNNQTRSYLMQRFSEIGIRPRTNLGQNFLIDLNLLRLLHSSAQLESNDVVLEVGTGTGSLTGLMSQNAGRVITVEVDSAMHQLAKEELQERENITFLHTDILQNKNRLSPLVLDAVRSALAEIPNSRFKLAANLPYCVATPLMSNLLLSDVPPYSMTVTIQKELAERIVAKPSTKDYSALSLWMQSQCHCRIIRNMPPSVFWPRPKVNSAIVQATFDLRLRKRIPDLSYFHQFCRETFFHRRKFLRSVLIAMLKDKLGKPEVDDVMTKMNFTDQTRAESLSVETLLKLCETIRTIVQAKKTQ